MEDAMRTRNMLLFAFTLGTAAEAPAVPAVQTGLLGLARLQTARLSVTNLTPLDPDVPPNPCIVTLAYFDETGDAFIGRDGNPLAREARLFSGESSALELPWTVAFGGDPGLRRAFRASLESQPGPPNTPGPCSGLATSVEIYDNLTGRTSVAQNPGPPTAPVGLLGLARLQTARLSVTNLTALDPDAPPNPCIVTLGFFGENGEAFVDRDGNPLASEADLFPGESGALELPWTAAFEGGFGLRRAFRASLESQPGPPTTPDPCSGLATTVEIYDNLTGRTSVATNPGPPTAPLTRSMSSAGTASRSRTFE
jgi:hypothetical protein